MNVDLESINQEDFWRYSLSRYQFKDLQDQLLNLQNNFNGEVNLALLCLWLDSKHIQIDRYCFVFLEAVIFERSDKIKLLRNAREVLKLEISSEQYEQILNIELNLEKKQQSDLVEKLKELKFYDSKKPENFSFYLERLGFYITKSSI